MALESGLRKQSRDAHQAAKLDGRGSVPPGRPPARIGGGKNLSSPQQCGAIISADTVAGSGRCHNSQQQYALASWHGSGSTDTEHNLDTAVGDAR